MTNSEKDLTVKALNFIQTKDKLIRQSEELGKAITESFIHSEEPEIVHERLRDFGIDIDNLEQVLREIYNGYIAGDKNEDRSDEIFKF